MRPVVPPPLLLVSLAVGCGQATTYDLVPQVEHTGNRPDTQAWIGIGASASVGPPTLTPIDGSHTLERVALEHDGRPRIARLAGRFAGRFRRADANQHRVSGCFDFTR